MEFWKAFGVEGVGGGIHFMGTTPELCVYPTYPHLYTPVGVGGWGCVGAGVF